MKKQLAASLVLIVLPVFLISCVSSLLKESPPTFSKDVKWSDLKEPFVKIKSPIYPAWKNKNTGNVISIISDCAENSLQTLVGMHQLIENSVDSYKLVKEQKILFQNKTALLHFSEGEIDGDPIEIQSLSFKRKTCTYVTSLSGKKNNLAGDRRTFDQFNESLTFE